MDIVHNLILMLFMAYKYFQNLPNYSISTDVYKNQKEYYQLFCLPNFPELNKNDLGASLKSTCLWHRTCDEEWHIILSSICYETIFFPLSYILKASYHVCFKIVIMTAFHTPRNYESVFILIHNPILSYCLSFHNYHQ